MKRNIQNKVRHGDKGGLTADLAKVFLTGAGSYTAEKAWGKWVAVCAKWGKDYRTINRMGESASYKSYFTYLNYHPKVQPMVYTTNWIERLQRDFRRITRMRGSMTSEDSVIVLMGKTAMDKTVYSRALPGIDLDKKHFPDCKFLFFPAHSQERRQGKEKRLILNVLKNR